MDFSVARKLLHKFTTEKLKGNEAHYEAAPYRVGNSKFKASNPRKAAVLVLIYPYIDRAHFAVIQRPVYNGDHSGQIALPGGKWEESDSSLIGTALREAWEETNISSKEVNIIGEMTKVFIPPSNFEVTPVLGYSESRPNFKKDDYEVKEIIEIELAHLLDPLNFLETQIQLNKGGVIDTPYFNLGNQKIWGATAMMLNELKHLLL